MQNYCTFARARQARSGPSQPRKVVLVVRVSFVAHQHGEGYLAVSKGLFQSVECVRHGAASPAGSTTKMGRVGSGGQLAQAAGRAGHLIA